MNSDKQNTDQLTQYSQEERKELERVTRLCLGIVKEDLSRSAPDKKARQEEIDRLLHNQAF
jgi:hypothetical protein